MVWNHWKGSYTGYMAAEAQRVKGIFRSIITQLTQVRICNMSPLQITLGGQSVITNSPNKEFYLVRHLHLPNSFPEASLIGLIG